MRGVDYINGRFIPLFFPAFFSVIFWPFSDIFRTFFLYVFLSLYKIAGQAYLYFRASLACLVLL
jgi:hypothetical protein